MDAQKRLEKLRKKRQRRNRPSFWYTLVFSPLFLIFVGLLTILLRPQPDTRIPEPQEKTILGLFLVQPTATLTPALTPTLTETPTPSPTLTRTPTPIVLVVRTGLDGGNLNLRVCPSMGCRVITTLPEGSELEFVACHDGWIEIKASILAGFVWHEEVDENPCKQ